MQVIKVVFLLLFSIACLGLKGQDIIVTTNQDSIRCLVLDQGSQYVTYRLQSDETNKKRLLPIDKVTEVKLGAYSIPKASKRSSTHDSLRMRLRFNANSGLSLMFNTFGSGVEALTTHTENAKYGTHVNATLTFQTIWKNDLGFSYSHFFVSNSSEQTILINSNQGILAETEAIDDVKVDYIGFTILRHLTIGESGLILIVQGSPGMLFYRNDATLFSDDFKLKGETFGLQVGIGLEKVLSDRFALSLSSQYIWGRLQTVNGGFGPARELQADKNLSRLDLSLGLSWYPSKSLKGR
jgi:hypothetical protein